MTSEAPVVPSPGVRAVLGVAAALGGGTLVVPPGTPAASMLALRSCAMTSERVRGPLPPRS